MAYGLKYSTQFDSQSDDFNPSVTYTLQFLYKDYVGNAISIDGGGTTVLQKCTDDNPLAPVKGSSLDISLINAGNLPITSFYADNDDDIKVVLLDGSSNVLWEGFLVQDDCTETKVDYEHEIQLSVNDGLGLLKGVPLDEAPGSYELLYDSTELIETIAPNKIRTDMGFGSTVVVGDKIVIYGTAQAGTYTVQTYIITGGFYYFTVEETIGTMAAVSTLIGLLHKNLDSVVTLLSLVQRCLSATNLSLLTNIFSNIKEFYQNDTESFLNQTMINPDVFISGETYRDCYGVLETIMSTFDLQIFQANGQWNIIHWYEIRKFANGAIPAFVYDESMVLLSTTVFNNTFAIGPDVPSPQPTVPTYELRESILRPYKFVRRTFNYNQSKYLLSNFDLKQLGPLITSYIQGTFTMYEYIATGFADGDVAPHGPIFIRVVKDTATDTEVDRYFVVQPPQGFYPRAARALSDIIINIGDTATFTASMRINVMSSLPINVLMSFRITDGTNTYYLHNNSSTGLNEWNATFGYDYNIPPNTPAVTWNQVEAAMPPFPISGVLTIHYALAYFNPTGTFWKDMRFEYVSRVNESTKIIGHIHKQNRINDIKNNSDEEIILDDSPRNIINGTLLLSTTTGLAQDRTRYWVYIGDANAWRRGELFTREEIVYRGKMRSKLEGGFLGLKQTALVSLLTVVNTDFNPGKNYIFGMLTIDYKRNQFNGTLWEIYDTAEPEVVADYTFTYIYSAT